MAQIFDQAKVTAAVAAALARGAEAKHIVRDLEAGRLDGLEGVSMSRRSGYRFVARARKRLVLPDEMQGQSSFLDELERQEAERQEQGAEVEVEVVPAATRPPEPVTAQETAPRSVPEPTREEGLVERVAVVLGTDLPGYEDGVRSYLTGAATPAELIGRLRRLQRHWITDAERNSAITAALRELEPQPEPVEMRRWTSDAWARELKRRDRARLAPPVTTQEAITGYKASGWPW